MCDSEQHKVLKARQCIGNACELAAECSRPTVLHAAATRAAATRSESETLSIAGAQETQKLVPRTSQRCEGLAGPIANSWRR